MKYRWTECPSCHCELAINYAPSPRGEEGSLRRWSTDRSVNDGRSFSVAESEISAESFTVPCVCGQPIVVPAKADAVSAEREGDLRVKLGE